MRRNGWQWFTWGILRYFKPACCGKVDRTKTNRCRRNLCKRQRFEALKLRKQCDLFGNRLCIGSKGLWELADTNLWVSYGQGGVPLQVSLSKASSKANLLVRKLPRAFCRLHKTVQNPCENAEFKQQEKLTRTYLNSMSVTSCDQSFLCQAVFNRCWISLALPRIVYASANATPIIFQIVKQPTQNETNGFPYSRWWMLENMKPLAFF